jgi:hypothetical protein
LGLRDNTDRIEKVEDLNDGSTASKAFEKLVSERAEGKDFVINADL